MKYFVFIIFSCVLVFSCVEKQEEKLRTLFSTETDYEDSCTSNKARGIAFNGNYYTKADSNSAYSAGINYYIPMTINNLMMRVYVDFYCRKGGEDFGQEVVVSLQKGDSVLIWRRFPISGLEVGDKEWTHILDSTQFFYTNPHNKFMQVKVFAFDKHKGSYLEMDNLKVTIKEVFIGEKKTSLKNNNQVFSKFIDFEDSLMKPRTRGCAFNGKYYTHVTGNVIYGGGMVYQIPDSLNNSSLRVKLNYFCRTDTMNPSLKMVVTAQDNDTLLFYKEFALEKYKVSTKFWTNITDSVQFKYKNYGRKNVMLKVFTYNISKEAYVDVDDLTVVLETW